MAFYSARTIEGANFMDIIFYGVVGITVGLVVTGITVCIIMLIDVVDEYRQDRKQAIE